MFPQSPVLLPQPCKSLSMKPDNQVAVCIMMAWVSGQDRNQIQDWWLLFTAFPLLIKLSADAVDKKLYARFQE